MIVSVVSSFVRVSLQGFLGFQELMVSVRNARDDINSDDSSQTSQSSFRDFGLD